MRLQGARQDGGVIVDGNRRIDASRQFGWAHARQSHRGGKLLPCAGIAIAGLHQSGLSLPRQHAQLHRLIRRREAPFTHVFDLNVIDGAGEVRQGARHADVFLRDQHLIILRRG